MSVVINHQSFIIGINHHHHHHRLRRYCHQHHHHRHRKSLITITFLFFSRYIPGMESRIDLVVGVSPANFLIEVIESATLNPLCYPNSYWAEVQHGPWSLLFSGTGPGWIVCHGSSTSSPILRNESLST